MKRRDAITAAALLCIAPSVRAQDRRLRSIGVLMGYSEDDSEAQARYAAFKDALTGLGWIEGGNLRTTVRWAASDPARAAAFAKELVALKPDAIVTSTTPASVAVQRETRTIPIVFTVVSDPVGSGLVKSLAHPGGNVTGLINIEASLVGKSLELLKEIAPHVSRVAAMFNPDTAPYIAYYLDPFKASAPKFGMAPFETPVRDEAQIGLAIEDLGRGRHNGLVVMTDSFMTVHRRAVIDQCARHKVPAVYATKIMAQDGGLLSYGPDVTDLFRRAAPFVDRVLRGRPPSDMPVQQPTKFELAVNMKTASTLGITFPNSVLMRADQVIP
jgi:putative ABC transport system substrate-binding protein